MELLSYSVKKNGDEVVKSADAIYFSDLIYFIEFKSGIRIDGNSNDDYIIDCIAKGINSLKTHERIINKYSSGENSYHTIKNDYIVVMNSSSKGFPSKAFALTSAKLSGVKHDLHSKLSDEIFEKQKELKYRFDQVHLWNDIYFDNRISKL